MMDEQKIVDRDTVIRAAKEVLMETNIMKNGLQHLRKTIAPGAPFRVLELLEDPERIDELVAKIAELYVDMDFTVEELNEVRDFHTSEVGKKLVKANLLLQPKSMEVTQDWLYDIIGEARLEEKTKEESDVIEVPDTGEIPDVLEEGDIPKG